MNADKRQERSVVSITNKWMDERLQLFGFVRRKDKDISVGSKFKLPILGNRSRRRQKKRWSDTVKEGRSYVMKEDMKTQSGSRDKQ